MSAAPVVIALAPGVAYDLGELIPADSFIRCTAAVAFGWALAFCAGHKHRLARNEAGAAGFRSVRVLGPGAGTLEVWPAH